MILNFNKYCNSLNENVQTIVNKDIEKLKKLDLNESDLIKLKLIIDGNKSIAFHGSNRDFKKFDMSFLRKERTDQFTGDGIFLTPDKYVARRYADSNINNSLPITILKDAEKIDPELADFMNSLYYKGNITWSLPKFEKLIHNWKFPIDPNDVAELVNLIPGSQSEKDYIADSSQNNNGFFNIFSTHTSALDYYHIEYLEKLGFGDYNPKVYTVIIHPTDSVLVSNNIEKIRIAKNDIIISYNVPDLIDDIPEIIVRNPNLLEVIKKENI
jgi:hypothetical protein